VGAIHAVPNPLPGHHVRRFVEAQINHDRVAAIEIVSEMLAAGVDVTAIYLELIARAQIELGRLWEENFITVAQEHSGTAISQLALAQLYPRLPMAPRNGRSAMVACVEGERHELGARMVADFFESTGFTVIYLGADVPRSALIDYVQRHRPDIVGLSVTMSYNLPALFDSIIGVVDVVGDSHSVIAGGSGTELIDRREHDLPFTISTGDALSKVRQLAGMLDELPGT
jgi:MerR family transcriptional regulator, light-induced transcriptional regulator